MDDLMKSLKKRIKAAEARKALWRDLYEETYEYFLPQRENYTKRAEGQDKNSDKTYDSTARNSTFGFANRIQSVMVPPNKKWCRLIAGENVVETERDRINRELEDITQVTFQFINSSNMAVEVGESLLDLAIGTAAFIIEDTGDANAPIRFKSIPSEELFLEEGMDGAIDTVFRKFEVTNRNLERQYAKIDPERMKTIKDKQDTKVTVWEAVVYNPETKDYTFYAIDWKKEFIMEEATIEVSPWIVFRWAAKSGEIYGRGPAINALPDAITLNKIRELELAASALSIYNMYTYIDDSDFDVENITLGFGKFIPVGENTQLTPLVVGSEIQTANIESAKLQDAIKEALFSLKLPPVSGTPHTATEISIRQQELQQDIGSAFGRLQQEFIVPTMKRCVYILQQHGIVGELRLDNSQLVDVQVTAPIARNNEEVENTLDWLTMLTNISASISQGFVFGNAVKVSDIPKFLAQKKGVDLDLLVSDEELKENMEQEEEANKEAEGINQGLDASQIAKNLDMTIDPETGEPKPKQG